MTSNLLLWNIGGMEVLVLALLVVLLFGGKKIPELMKALGKGTKSFKQGVAEAESEIKQAKKEIEKPVEEEKKEKE